MAYMTKSVGFLWRRPKHVALNIRYSAHTKGRLPDSARTDGWRTRGREPWAVTGATATIRLSYFAAIGLAMLMLLVPFQQGYMQERPVGVTQHRQSCSSVPSPAPLPSSRLPACLALLRPGQALRAGSSLGKDWKRWGRGKENLNASKSGVSLMGTEFL